MAFRSLLHKWYVISSLFLPSLERVASTALVFGFARPMEKACLAPLYCPPTYMREEGSHAEKPACSHIRHAQLSCAPNPVFLPQGAFQPNIFPPEFPLSLLKKLAGRGQRLVREGEACLVQSLRIEK